MTGAGPRIDVVVVDDDALVRAGLTLILGGAPDIVIVGEACDGQQVHDVVRRTSPRVVLMDIRMPYRDGVRATARLMTLAQPPQGSRRSTPTSACCRR